MTGSEVLKLTKTGQFLLCWQTQHAPLPDFLCEDKYFQLATAKQPQAEARTAALFGVAS